MNQFWRGLIGGLIALSSVWVGGYAYHLWPPFPKDESWYDCPRFFTIFVVSLAIFCFGMWVATFWEPKRKDRK